jgi:CPA2 family monovalent cation:H+ antiporter-2
VAVAVSGITTLSTPWLIRAADPAAAFIDRKLPRALQTFAALYGTWLERLRTTRARSEATSRAGRVLRFLVLDAALLSALIVGVAVWHSAAAATLVGAVGLDDSVADALVLAGAAALAIPLVLGIGRLSRRLGSVLAEAALPREAGRADFGAAPRRAFDVTLQLGIATLAGVGILAVTQPFLPGYAGPAVLGALLVAAGIAVWRRAEDLESHVRAGAEAVVAALTSHVRDPRTPAAPQPIREVQDLLPGLGAPVALRLDAASPAVGKTLAELNLRGRTGATVLAIARGTEHVVVPDAGERLAAGDVLALAGTREAIEQARGLLVG